MNYYFSIIKNILIEISSQIIILIEKYVKSFYLFTVNFLKHFGFFGLFLDNWNFLLF